MSDHPPKKITEYLAIEEQSNSELVLEVTRLIGEGWQPQGGVSIAARVETDRDNDFINTSFSFHQAMVR